MAFQNKIYFLLLFILLGCGGVNYSFKSTDIPQTAKTIAIMQFYNESANGPSNISQVFTEKLRDYFQNNTKLALINDPNNADLVLDGVISNYNVSPISPTSDGVTETAAQQKLSISVNASYTNYSDTTQSFDKPFSAFSIFEASQNLSDVETEKIEDISEQIIIKIFTASFDTW